MMMKDGGVRRRRKKDEEGEEEEALFRGDIPAESGLSALRFPFSSRCRSSGGEVNPVADAHLLLFERERERESRILSLSLSRGASVLVITENMYGGKINCLNTPSLVAKCPPPSNRSVFSFHSLSLSLPV